MKQYGLPISIVLSPLTNFTFSVTDANAFVTGKSIELENTTVYRNGQFSTFFRYIMDGHHIVTAIYAVHIVPFGDIIFLTTQVLLPPYHRMHLR
jgi:hypothetical protein